MEKKSKTITNYIYSSLYQIFLIIVPLVTAPYLARTLLPTGTGINSYVSSVVTIFTSLGLIGLNSYSLREIAYVRDDKKKLQQTFSELFILRIICFIITTIIYLVYSLLSDYKLFLLVESVAVMAAFLDIAWIYQGFEEFKVTVTRNFIVKILNVISIFIFIKGPDDLLLFMVISSIFSVLVNLILYFGVKKRVGSITLKNINIKKHVWPTIKLFIPQVASMIYLQCDKVMLKFLAENITYTGFYDQAERIIKMPLALITALSTVMLPKISNEYKKNNSKVLKDYLIKAFRFSLLMAIPLMFGISAIAKNFIPWFLGDGYEEVIPIMMFLSMIVFFISMSSVSGSQYLTAIDKTKVLTKACCGGAILNVIINSLLIPKYNAIGAAIGTIATEFFVFVIELVNIKEIISFKELLLFGKNYLISGVIMFIICLYLGKILSPSILSSLIQIGCGGIIYFALLFVLKDKFFYECLDRSKKLLKIKR